MKKLFLALLVLSGFLLTSAQIKDAGTGSPLPPGTLGNAELFVCEEAAKTAATPIDKSRFQNFVSFTSNGTFTVPAGVTEVLIEMWGAGGGGHFPGGGGGSGGYWTGLVSTTGITTITLNVGTGGASGTHTAAGGNGGNTSFSCTGFNVTAAGGLGADSSLSTTFENYRGGRGGAGMVLPVTMPATYKSFFAINGQSGTGSAIDFIQVNATIFARRLTGGVGGIAPFSGQPANTVATNLSLTGTAIRSVNSTLSTFVASSFGSGGNCLATGSTAGGPGRVAIYF